MNFRIQLAAAISTTVLASVLVVACGPTGQPEDAETPSDEPESHAMNETPTFSQEPYGELEDGTAVTKVTLKNGRGVEVDVISYGGLITRLVTPDAGGEPGNIVQGLDSLEEYVSSNPHFGAPIGRYGNRIAGGTFTLDGTTYQLPQNDGENHLHGGEVGFDKKIWTLEPFTTDHSAGVTLTLVSPDGDEGYPGTLEVRGTYELNDKNELDLRFSATTDAPTIVNLTHHSYFNLAGEGDALDHRLTIPADTFTPVREGLIPTGELRSVDGTPFDFREPKAIGRDIEADDEQLALGKGYDHNFVVKDVKEEVDDELVLAARVTEPTSGRVMEVWSVEPGVQLYSGNFLDGSLKGGGKVHTYRSSFCLEPQHFPDSPNQPDFPSTVLRPGETYETQILYRFSTETQPATFTNPLNQGGPDPWVTWHEGHYYLAATTWADASVGLTMRKAPTIAELKEAEPVQIFQDSTPDRCCNFWAPELFLLDGPNGKRWYGYYTGGAAGEDFVNTQFQHVIESEGTDPMGPYHYKGKLVERNALDATVMEHDGKLYAVYSVWNETQDLAIKEMSSPWETVGEEVTLSKPTLPWEVQTHTVNEGPVAIHRDGRTFVVFSASACWGPDYKLGLLELTGDDPLDPEAWHKFPEPIFERADDRGVFAPGHNTFFKSPDGTEDWIAYHANDLESDVCDMGRTPRIQKFTWKEDGTPDFGIPVDESTELAVPSRNATKQGAGE